jgi:hypothetical protein
MNLDSNTIFTPENGDLLDFESKVYAVVVFATFKHFVLGEKFSNYMMKSCMR